MDGTTDFTATSHGISMYRSPRAMVLCRNLFKHDGRHIYMTYVLGEETNDDPLLRFSFSSLSGAVGCQAFDIRLTQLGGG